MDIMIDLETLGTKPSSAILTLAAVAFDPLTVEDHRDILRDPERRLLVHIDPISCEQYQRTIDAGTVLWWLQQEKAAQNALLSEQRVGLPAAVSRFTCFVNRFREPRLWANSPTFDGAMLRSSYEAVQAMFPIPYYRDRDVRSLTAIVWPEPFSTPNFDSGGVAHDALADCVKQIQQVQVSLDLFHRHQK